MALNGLHKLVSTEDAMVKSTNIEVHQATNFSVRININMIYLLVKRKSFETLERLYTDSTKSGLRARLLHHGKKA